MWPSLISSAMAMLVASAGVTAYSMKLESLDNIIKRSVDYLPLTQTHDLYAGIITVGDPPQKFSVVLDTGSADTVIFDTQCGDACHGRSLYDPTASSTSVDTGEDFKLDRADRSGAEGIVYNDTITIGTIKGMEQAIGGASSFTGPFDTFNFPFDGILGLGFPEVSTFQKRPVFDTFIAQGAVDHPVFGIKFTETAGELDLGAVNADLYTGDLAIVEVVHEGRWQIKMDSLIVNGQEIVADIEAIVDTTARFITLPAHTSESANSAIGAQKESEGMYTVDCSLHIDFTLTFAGTAYPANRVPNGGGVCYSVFQDSAPGDNVATFGSLFLRHVYTVFSRDPKYVGFATLA